MNISSTDFTLGKLICVVTKIATFTKAGECFPQPKGCFQQMQDYLYGVNNPREVAIKELWNRMLIALSVRPRLRPKPSMLQSFERYLSGLSLQTELLAFAFILGSLLIIAYTHRFKVYRIYPHMKKLFHGLNYTEIRIRGRQLIGQDVKTDSSAEKARMESVIGDHCRGKTENKNMSYNWLVRDTIKCLLLKVKNIICFLRPIRCKTGSADFPWSEDSLTEIAATFEGNVMSCNDVTSETANESAERSVKCTYGKTTSASFIQTRHVSTLMPTSPCNDVKRVDVSQQGTNTVLYNGVQSIASQKQRKDNSKTATISRSTETVHLLVKSGLSRIDKVYRKRRKTIPNRFKRSQRMNTAAKAVQAVRGVLASDKLVQTEVVGPFWQKENTTPNYNMELLSRAEGYFRNQAISAMVKENTHLRERKFQDAPLTAACKGTEAKTNRFKSGDSVSTMLSCILADSQRASGGVAMSRSVKDEQTDNTDGWSVDLSELSFEAHEERIKREMAEYEGEYDWHQFDEDLKKPVERRLRDTLWDGFQPNNQQFITQNA